MVHDTGRTGDGSSLFKEIILYNGNYVRYPTLIKIQNFRNNSNSSTSPSSPLGSWMGDEEEIIIIIKALPIVLCKKGK